MVAATVYATRFMLRSQSIVWREFTLAVTTSEPMVPADEDCSNLIWSFNPAESVSCVLSPPMAISIRPVPVEPILPEAAISDIPAPGPTTCILALAALRFELVESMIEPAATVI